MIRPALIAAILLAVATTSLAQDSDETKEVARVRSGLITKPPTWVAQEVSFYVELMSSTFFSGSPRFDLPEIPGVILMKVEGRPVLGTDTVGDDSWTTQRHEFRAYAHRAGTITIPPFPVRFSVAPAFGSPPQEQRMQTEQISFEAKMPPGAESVAMLVSTSRLDVSDGWNPKPDEDGVIRLQVGDALQRQITLEAVDVPGMALPPIQLSTPDGMSAYPKSPEVADQADRGDLVGSRTESITYVCQREGSVLIPSQVITWWDIKADKLHRAELKAITVEVEAAESPAAELPPTGSASESPRSGRKLLRSLLIATFAFAAIYWFAGRKLGPWLKARRERNATSEKALFAKVQAACHGGSPTECYNAVTNWCGAMSNSSQTVTLESLSQSAGSQALHREWDSLQKAVVGDSQNWDGETLLVELTQLKHQLLQANRERNWGNNVLPELNPSSE